MKLLKKIIITGQIEAKTGLHIGGSDVGFSIGGADSPVIRDPLTNVPYIPGSTIKGKMRSLLEKVTPGIAYNKTVGHAKIHQCAVKEPSQLCPICRLFGLPAEADVPNPPRLYVRDAQMNPESEKLLAASPNTDMPYTEIKTEVVIDRVTSAATPRQIERVPAGALFDLEIVLNIYDQDDEKELLNLLEEGRRLLNDDYLGGSGTRGYGKIAITFTQIAYKDEKIYKGDNRAVPLEG